ncbi:MAG TPA: hypothetical protein VGB63_15785 [Pedobacter sp.]|jgi:alkaline phosphatase
MTILKEDVTLFTSLFAASKSVTRLGTVTLAQVRKIEDPIKSHEFTIKTEPRILMNDTLNVIISISDGTGSNSIVSTISIPYFKKAGKKGLVMMNYFSITTLKS